MQNSLDGWFERVEKEPMTFRFRWELRVFVHVCSCICKQAKLVCGRACTSTENGEKDGFKGGVFHSVSHGTCNVEGARKTRAHVSSVRVYFLNRSEYYVLARENSISNLMEGLQCVVLVKFPQSLGGYKKHGCLQKAWERWQKYIEGLQQFCKLYTSF
ncbi:uncharacterized protein LOC122528762 isoform X3 [Frieseomelitta varia]|uniref:uncharacterized protein LOC122528762 isoform X3 n=1 Tax=Frieseomelitta varia TaxID=561572 RepID=UPI001CB6ACEB|nr:uncharacterized protein LOC122528762 isoform X3 [Frieseomelitta varia]XP_043510164.1 uncharacterized protein LOC122528762 isoform X3 [Frieseomelitta varia]